MKKILFTVLILLGVLTLSACATRRNQPPVITVENPTQVIQQGDDFDPLAGVIAEDPEDGDITDQIQIDGYEEGDNDVIGTYVITLSVEDSAGATANATINLTVEGDTEVEPPVLYGVVPQQTYYIGSGDYDPRAGITAEAPDGTDITDDIVFSGVYLLDAAGTYTINVRVTYEGVRASASIRLTVIDSNIPTELTGNVTITFWHAMGEANTDLVKGYADDFMEMYPNVTINIPEGVGNYDTLKGNMINAITAGDFPNMVQGYPDHVAEYLNGNAVVNLNPYIYSSQWGLNGDDALDDIIGSYLEENTQYDANGTFYSLPFNKSTEVMIYNKTVFDKLNLDVPETWQDIIAIAPQLRAEGREIAKQKVLAANPGKRESQLTNEIAAAQALVVPASYDSTGNAFITFARQFGGEYTSLNYSTFQGNFLWHQNANTFAAMQFLKDNKSIITLPEFWDQQYASTPFVNQQTFVTVGSSAGVRYNVPSGDLFEIGVAPVPYNENMPDEKAVIQQGTNISLMNTGTPQQKLASWLFLKFLINTENTVDWAMNTGYLPVRTSGYTSDRYQAFLNEPTNDQKYISMAANAAYLQSGHMFFDPAFIGSSRARTQVGLALERIMLGDGNIQNALDEAYNEARKGA